jgi:Sulfotransferase family
MYAFVHIDKTGGTTLDSILRRSFGTRHCDIRVPIAKRRHNYPDHRVVIEAADLRRIKRLYRNLRGIAGHNVRAYSDLEVACPSIRYFTIVREPLSRFRSHYLSRGGHSRQEFDRWISAPWVRNWQTKMIAGEPNAQRAIDLLATRFGFVGLTERFDESLVMLDRWLEEPAFRPEYRRLNQLSENRPDIARNKIDLRYMDSDYVHAQIQEANLEDRKVYDFVKSTLYPLQRATYGDNLKQALREFQQCNQSNDRLTESAWSRLMRNCVYKPLIHCRAA